MLSGLAKRSVCIAAIFAVLTTANGQTQCSNTSIYFEEVAKSCTKYIRCVFGLRSEHTCDEGFQFDPATSRCDLESIVGCNKCPENIEFGEFLAYDDPENCSSGFVCFGEIYPFQVDCQADLHFDVTTLMCISPQHSNCSNPVTTTEATTTTSTTTTTTTTPKPTTTTTKATTTTTTTTTPAPGYGCEWSGCYHASGAVCSTPNTGGSGRDIYIKHKKCELIGRKDFCCDRRCKHLECGKKCESPMKYYPSDVGDLTCTIPNVPGLGSVQSVQKYCCP